MYFVLCVCVIVLVLAGELLLACIVFPPSLRLLGSAQSNGSLFSHMTRAIGFFARSFFPAAVEYSAVCSAISAVRADQKRMLLLLLPLLLGLVCIRLFCFARHAFLSVSLTSVVRRGGEGGEDASGECCILKLLRTLNLEGLLLAEPFHY